jgi:molybdopterin/thiamine biosynthesis adenylyltransferase
VNLREWGAAVIGWSGRVLGGHSDTGSASIPEQVPLRMLDVRIDGDRFGVVCAHVENFRRGEEAGYLVCGVSRLPDRDVLLVRDWMPVPEWAIERNVHGSVLSWSSKFNSEALQRALDMNATLVLVHSHGSANPTFSSDDRVKEPPLFAPFSRMLDPLPTGTLLLGKGAAAGSFWLGGQNEVVFRRLVIISDTIDTWHSAQLPRPKRAPRKRLVRQAPVVGPDGDAKLAEAKVAIIGVSGGGSHVVQQLAHQGVGTPIPLDDQTVDESNLGRVVGATEDDIGRTTKTALAKRVATGVDSSIHVIEVEARFPSPKAIAALKDADIVIACVDTFRAREAINAFCRRYLIPLVDVGIFIRTKQEKLVRADGQVIVSLPGRACTRCWFITDAVLEKERRERPPGYDENPAAVGEPQVVSMNGTLASEACNCVLDLLTGYSGGMRGAKFWQYEGRSGQLEQHPLPTHRPGCPACAEEGFGDPTSP